jgi:hypothetical protein
MTLEIAISDHATAMLRLALAIELLAAAITSDNLASGNPYPATLAAGIGAAAAQAPTQSVMGAAVAALGRNNPLPATAGEKPPIKEQVADATEKRRGPGRPRKQPESITRVDTGHVEERAGPHVGALDTQPVEETESARADAAGQEAPLVESDPETYKRLSDAVVDLCDVGPGEAGYERAMKILDHYGLQSAKHATASQYAGLMNDITTATSALKRAAAAA